MQKKIRKKNMWKYYLYLQCVWKLDNLINVNSFSAKIVNVRGYINALDNVPHNEIMETSEKKVCQNKV